MNTLETTLDRHPPGSEHHDAIVKLGKKWDRTDEWRFRKKMEASAGALLGDVEAIYDRDEELDPLLMAECAVDLAEACREYLKTFNSYVNE